MTDNSKAAANKQARDEKKTAYLRGIMDRYMGEFRAGASDDAPSLARAVHARIQIVIESDREKSPESDNIKCGKGCSHCCRGPVEIWPQEAALLIERAREMDVALDMARLERQSRQTLDTWVQQPAADTACVFLGSDGACTVYEFRPNACRKLLVVTDPALCDAQKHPSESVGRWFSWEAEILESAAQEVFGAGLMPRLLLDRLK